VPAPSGFTYEVRRTGEVVLSHRGRAAGTLRGDAAARFLAEIESTGGGDAAAQLVMARATGNYRRGNERLASRHPRNR
jgi:hypothetical protein